MQEKKKAMQFFLSPLQSGPNSRRGPPNYGPNYSPRQQRPNRRDHQKRIADSLKRNRCYHCRRLLLAPPSPTPTPTPTPGTSGGNRYGFRFLRGGLRWGFHHPWRVWREGMGGGEGCLRERRRQGSRGRETNDQVFEPAVLSEGVDVRHLEPSAASP